MWCKNKWTYESDSKIIKDDLQQNFEKHIHKETNDLLGFVVCLHPQQWQGIIIRISKGYKNN